MNDGRQISHDRQMSQLGLTEDFPRIAAADALPKLTADEFWIRSVNLEFHYRYAVVEDSDTGERFVVRDISDEQWAELFGWVDVFGEVDDDARVAAEPARSTLTVVAEWLASGEPYDLWDATGDAKNGYAIAFAEWLAGHIAAFEKGVPLPTRSAAGATEIPGA